MLGRRSLPCLLVSVLLLGLSLPVLADSGGKDGQAAEVLDPEAAIRKPEMAVLALSRGGCVQLRRAKDRPGAPVIGVRLEGAADADLQWLAAFPHLQSLEIDSEQVTDRGMKHVARLRHLREIRLSCPRFTEQGLFRLQTALPRARIGPYECQTGYREPAALAP